MSVSWDPTPKAVSYMVRVAWEAVTKKKIRGVMKVVVAQKAQVLKTTSTNQLVTKLLPGTKYFITVTSFSESGRKSEDGEIFEEQTGKHKIVQDNSFFNFIFLVPPPLKLAPIVKSVSFFEANFTYKVVKGGVVALFISLVYVNKT